MTNLSARSMKRYLGAAIVACSLALTGPASAGDLDGIVVVGNGNHTMAAILTLIHGGVIPSEHVFTTVDGDDITAAALLNLYESGNLVTRNEPLIGGKIDEIIQEFDPAKVNIDLYPGVQGKPFRDLQTVEEAMVLGANAKPAVLSTVGSRISTLTRTAACVLDKAGKCVDVVQIATDPVGAAGDRCLDGVISGNPFCLIGGSLVYVAIAPHFANAGADYLTEQALQLEPEWIEAEQVLNQEPTHATTYSVDAGLEMQYLYEMTLDEYTDADIDFMLQHVEFAQIIAELYAEGRL